MSILTALQTLNQLSNSTRVLLSEGDADSVLALFHTHLANSMQRMYQHPALLGVKFLGVNAKTIPEEVTLKNLVLSEISQIQQQIEYYGSMDHVNAAKNKMSLIKVFALLTKMV